MTKTWFITGCSTGLGRALCETLLSETNHQVVVTARKKADIEDFEKRHADRVLCLSLDVCKDDQAKAAVNAAIDRFGKIDVLVNNAGIGYFSALEEADEDAVRNMFEINVFGLDRMTRLVLPHMRAKRSGRILNIASIAGMIGYPAISHYNATKFAVVGLTESLNKEVSPLGIHAISICPSGFRTDWAGRSAIETPSKLEDYRETAEKNRRAIREMSGNQPGDPVAAARAMIAVANLEQPPGHLMLGAAAVKNSKDKLDRLKAEIELYEQWGIEADQPKK
ncbi:MAG TPA: oxidoreductase [Luteibaculaceae bacterium]|nr:oxidoreductase [Luteibaculaceae bacterium]